VIFAPVIAVTLDAWDLGQILNGRNGDPDEELPFLFLPRGARSGACR
jgi:hypothetical protein